MSTVTDLLTPDRAAKQRRRGGCDLGKLLPSLTDTDRDSIETALGDPETYTAVFIAAVLRTVGHDVSEGTVRRHRRGACRCDL